MVYDAILKFSFSNQAPAFFFRTAAIGIWTAEETNCFLGFFGGNSDAD
jgi:hypothetical protein